MFKFLILIFLTSPVFVNAQEKKITIKEKNATFQKVFEEIEKQTGYTIAYGQSKLDVKKKISISLKNVDIDKALSEILKKTGLSYKITGYHIILVSSSEGEGKSMSGLGYTLYPDTFATGKDHFLHEVVIVGNNKAQNLVSNPQMGAISVNQEGIKNIPTVFGEADIVKALQTFPGVSAGTEGLAGMYVRGGNDDENLYMLDGHPIYQVNHLGGLFSAFNAEAVKDVDFYKSSFPAQYGGRLSSVLDVHTKDGNLEECHGTFMLGLTSGNLNLEGPIVKGETGFNASIRRSWLEVLSVPGLAILNNIKKKDGIERQGRYAFTDLNLKINHKFNPDSKAFASLYYGNDYLKIGERNFPADEDAHYERKDDTKLDWGNLQVAAGWDYKMSDKLQSHFSASYTHYVSELERSIYRSTGTVESENLDESLYENLSKNGIKDYMLKLNFNYTPVQSHKISFGGNYIHHDFSPEQSRTKRLKEEVETITDYPNPKLSANEVAFYLEDDWEIFPALRVNAGLRWSLFRAWQKSFISWEPRASARILLSPVLSFKASYSRMSQYVQQISESYISLPSDYWMPISRNQDPLISDQVSSGFYYNLDSEYSFSVEGYYKWMKNLIEYRDGYNFLPPPVTWQDKLTTGKGWSYGIEFTARKEMGKLTGWFGYGLMWADRQFKEINNGNRFPAKFDNRHKINLVANYKINDKVELNGSWTYMTGNRITLSLESYYDLESAGFPWQSAPTDPYQYPYLDYYDTKNNIRLPAYHRLDLGINIYRPKKNGRMGIWNISFYNAYCRMNPIVVKKEAFYSGYFLEEGQREIIQARFRSVAIFPIIPSVSYTYKF